MGIQENIMAIQAKIAAAAAKSPKPNSPVTLVVVTKTRTPAEIAQVLAAGQLVLGENRVQELVDKFPQVPPEAQWHIIGHLQHNKVKYIADKVTMVHSLESLSLAEELSKRMTQAGREMDCLIQVNIADEESKYGLPKAAVLPFIRQIHRLPGIKIKGLMHIAPNLSDKEAVRPLFKEMYRLFREIDELALPNVTMRYLSMGMSGDYEIAVEEGANMVRIGSAVFAD